jgi:hypothetical protein
VVELRQVFGIENSFVPVDAGVEVGNGKLQVMQS